MKQGSLKIFVLGLLMGVAQVASAQTEVNLNGIINLGEIQEGIADIQQGAQGQPDQDGCGNECPNTLVGGVPENTGANVNTATVSEGVSDIIGSITIVNTIVNMGGGGGCVGQQCGGPANAQSAPLLLNLGGLPSAGSVSSLVRSHTGN